MGLSRVYAHIYRATDLRVLILDQKIDHPHSYVFYSRHSDLCTNVDVSVASSVVDS